MFLTNMKQLVWVEAMLKFYLNVNWAPIWFRHVYRIPLNQRPVRAFHVTLAFSSPPSARSTVASFLLPHGEEDLLPSKISNLVIVF